MRSAIVVRNLGKRFRRYHAERPSTLHEALLRGFRKLRPARSFWGLRDVSFNVAPGKMVGVIGRNGAGKSTLLRLLGGVGRPDEGSIKVRGRVGALLSLGAGFHPDLTGRENLFINAVIGGLTRRQAESCLDSILAFSELEDYIDSPLRAYSTGMQMRLAFSIAIHTRPDILLIDEVLAVGDVSFQRKCIDRITHLKSEGCAIVLVSHEAGMIRELCDEALLLRDGQLVAHGPAEDVVSEYIAEADAEQQTAASLPAEVILEESQEEPSEVEITGVRILDSLGIPATEFTSGDPVTVEIDYMARKPVDILNFQVYIERDDGLSCCEISTKTSVSNLTMIHGEGSVALHLEQLDLNGGLYHIDVGTFGRDWSYGYDYQEKVRSFSVRPTGIKIGVLIPPHRWEVKYRPAGEARVSRLKLPSTQT